MEPEELPVPVHDPDEVRRAAGRILEGDEFRDDRSLIRRLAEWLVDRIADLLDGVGGAGGGLGVVGTIIQLLLLGFAIAVIFLAVRTLVRAHGSRLSTDDDHDGVAIVLGAPADPADLRRRAEAAEDAGEWREALLARFRLVVALLIVDGVLADTPGRTTGEYRREFDEARPDQSSVFSAATRAFEAAFYGHFPVREGDVEDMRERADALVGDGVTVDAR